MGSACTRLCVWTTPSHRGRCLCRRHRSGETTSFPVDWRMLKKGETKTSLLPSLRVMFGGILELRDRYLTAILLDQKDWFVLTLGIFECQRIWQILKALARKWRERGTERESFPLQFKSNLIFFRRVILSHSLWFFLWSGGCLIL